MLIIFEDFLSMTVSPWQGQQVLKCHISICQFFYDKMKFVQSVTCHVVQPPKKLKIFIKQITVKKGLYNVYILRCVFSQTAPPQTSTSPCYVEPEQLSLLIKFGQKKHNRKDTIHFKLHATTFQLQSAKTVWGRAAVPVTDWKLKLKAVAAVPRASRSLPRSVINPNPLKQQTHTVMQASPELPCTALHCFRERKIERVP